MRYVISRKNSRSISKNIKKLIQNEKKLKLNNISSCIKFKKNCELSKKNLPAKDAVEPKDIKIIEMKIFGIDY